MRGRRIGAWALAFALCSTLLPVPAAHAYDFSDESYWVNKCSGVQSSGADSQACNAFKQYYRERQEELQQQVADFKNDIKALQEDMSNLESVVKQQQTLVNDLSRRVEEKNDAIAKIQKNIKLLDQDIAHKEKEINKWDQQIKERMLSEQASVGTNRYVDMIMGASDLRDMMRTLEGLQRITESDEQQIEHLEKEKKELDQKRSEQNRLKEEEEEQKESIEAEKQQLEEVKEANEHLIVEYRKKEAELQEQKRSVEVDLSTIADNLIGMDSINGYVPSTSDGWLNPVNGTTSAGTWYYPGGGLHLGVDRAVPIGTPIYAPADGLVVWVANPAPSNGGYLGNWVGYPYGAGNDIALLVNVKGTTYFVSFFHMSQNGMAVSVGQSVKQGQVIGLTGNSGNTSGPHCHIEIINLGNMSIQTAASQFAATADFAWGCGWSTTATSCGSKGSTPCRERPETLIG